MTLTVWRKGTDSGLMNNDNIAELEANGYNRFLTMLTTNFGWYIDEVRLPRTQ